jgi:hypothetical protein
MGSVNKAMKAVQGPAALTLREKMKKLYGHVKINGNNLKLLEWKSASNGEAHFASSEKALKNLEMTLLDPRSGQESLGPALPFVNTRS